MEGSFPAAAEVAENVFEKGERRCFAKGTTLLLSKIITGLDGDKVMRSKKCPACRGEIRVFDDNEPGDEVYCEECEQEFEILSLIPLRLEPLEALNYFEEESYGSYDDQYEA